MTITLTREEAQQILDALNRSDYLGWQVNIPITKMLRTRLSAPESEPVRLRRGDILRCIETNELCTVWATSTTGKTLVKWKANDFGQYTAEQIGDLFWVEPKPEPEPVAWLEPEWGEQICPEVGYEVTITADHPRDLCWIPLYTAPPQREWQGLTEDEAQYLFRLCLGRTYDDFWRAIEAKLKEKNT